MFLAFAGPTIQLVPDGTLIFHLVLIIVMVAVLNATLLKPINRILEERDRRTKGRRTEAQVALAKASEELREYERRLREARSEGYALVERERGILAGERERKLSEVKQKVNEDLARQRESIRGEAERAKVALASNAQNLAIDISSHILGRPVQGQKTT